MNSIVAKVIIWFNFSLSITEGLAVTKLKGSRLVAVDFYRKNAVHIYLQIKISVVATINNIRKFRQLFNRFRS